MPIQKRSAMSRTHDLSVAIGYKKRHRGKPTPCAESSWHSPGLVMFASRYSSNGSLAFPSIICLEHLQGSWADHKLINICIYRKP